MDVWSRLFVLLLILLEVFLFGIFWVAIIFWLGRILGRNNGKKAREEAEKRERNDPVYCPYCGCKEYPNGKLRPFYQCFDCGRHFTVNRDLTPEEQEIVREETEECARLRLSLPDNDLYKKIMDAIQKHKGWDVATIYASRGIVTADLLIYKGNSDYLFRGEEPYDKGKIDPIPVPYPLKSDAARLVFLGDLKSYINREYGYCLDASNGHNHCSLGITHKRT